MSDAAALPHFQYSSARHQADTAIVGMWLFLATEVLFFGGLILCWIYSRHWNPIGFDIGGRQTELWVGTLNTAILITSSFVYAVGLAFIRIGNQRRFIQCAAVTLVLAAAFLGLKFGLEWSSDFSRHLFPNDGEFPIVGSAAGGARLFFVFYFAATALHGFHMIVGIGLVSWLILKARAGAFTPAYHTPVHVVGLYWSFVDIVWLTLYPLIYLVGRG